MNKVDKIINKYKTVSDEIINVVKADFLKIETHHFTLANGSFLNRDVLIKKNINAAMIIPQLKDGNFIMVIQPRPCTERGVCIEFPAGYVEDGETIEKGAIRELEEETGAIANKVEKICTFYQDQACSKCLISILMAYNCDVNSKQKLDNDEFVDTVVLSYDEIIELQKQGYIVDANTTMCLCILKEKKLRGEL